MSTAAFPAGDKFLSSMDQASAYYKERVAHPLTFGTSYVHVGTVR
jgi:demethylmenaquinone methyltransferase/2-methoxy-6-polyprenyl-1,4-benzoquinol methylase